MTMGSGDSQHTHSDENLVGDTLRGLLWATIEKGGKGVIGVVVHLVLAWLLAPEHFGLIAGARVGVAFIGMFKDIGFTPAIVQRETIEDYHLDSAFWGTLVSAFVLTPVAIYLAPYIVPVIFNKEGLTAIMQVLLIEVPVLSIASVPRAILERNMRFKALSLRTFVAMFVGGVVAIVLALQGWGVWSLVAKTLISASVGAVILWGAIDWRPQFRFSYSHFYDLFAFGINVSGQKFMNFFNRYGDDWVIIYFLGPAAAGYYTVAYELLKGMTDLFARPMTSVALPAFSRIQSNIPKMREAFLLTVRYSSLVCFPVYFLFISVAPELYEVVYAPKWAECVPIARVLAGIGILHAVALLNSNLIKANGRADWEFRLSLLNVLGNITGFIIGAQFGIIGVATAYVVRGYLFSPIELYLVHRLIEYDVSRYLKELGGSVLGGLAVAGAVFGVKAVLPTLLPAYAVLGILLATGIATHFLFVYFVSGISVPEVKARLQEEISVS
jgi:PST family polysaccharide transporter